MIKCEDCRYFVDNVNEERPKMRFCAISGHAFDIMDKGLPIWGCPIKDAYMQNLNWLNAESDDDIVVEHLEEGQTINISHANVVIFD